MQPRDRKRGKRENMIGRVHSAQRRGKTCENEREQGIKAGK